MSTFKGIQTNVITEVQQKIDNLSIPKNFSVKPVLLHVGNIYDDVLTSNYFAKTINIADLLDKY